MDTKLEDLLRRADRSANGVDALKLVCQILEWADVTVPAVLQTNSPVDMPLLQQYLRGDVDRRLDYAAEDAVMLLPAFCVAVKKLYQISKKKKTIGKSKDVDYLQKAFMACLFALEHTVSRASSQINDKFVQVLYGWLKLLQLKASLKITTCIAKTRHFLTIPALDAKAFERNAVTNVKMPRNFSWAVPGVLAGMSLPTGPEVTRVFAELGFGLFVTAMGEGALSPELQGPLGSQTQYVHYPVPNYKPPLLTEMQHFMRLAETMLQQGKPMLVHCGGGKGRAGTFIACFMVKHGALAKPLLKKKYTYEQPAMSAAEAIKLVRTLRQGSIETVEQEGFVHQYAQELWRLAALGPQAVATATEAKMAITAPPLTAVQKQQMNDAPRFIIMTGMPGSGKSTFTSQLEKLKKLYPGPLCNWHRVSQDVLKKRTACEAKVRELLKPNKISGGVRIIIDRCNPTRDDRKLWIDMAKKARIKPLCVFMDTDRKVCLERVTNRKGHETINGSMLSDHNKLKGIVYGFGKKLQVPHRDEGAECVRLKTDADVITLLTRFGMSTETKTAVVGIEGHEQGDEGSEEASHHLVKFPRTRHILDMGGSAVSRDDLLVDEKDRGLYFGPTASEILVQEKVDGANMGISITADLQIVTQNRSHYVNFKTSSQFMGLDTWIDRHRTELFELLVPGRHILYGEWLRAQHTVAYDRLSDYFIAFDILDLKHPSGEPSFLSYNVLKACLAELTTIKIVPLLARQTFASQDALTALLETKSAYATDGFVEGVYLRVEDPGQGKLLQRCKLVRPDFIQSINDGQHWSKKVQVKNTLTY